MKVASTFNQNINEELPENEASLIREAPLTRPTPEPSTAFAHNLAGAVGWATLSPEGVPDLEKEIKFDPKTFTERTREVQMRWMEQNQDSANKRIVEDVISRSNALGLDAATELQGSGVGILASAQLEAAAALKGMETDPLGSALAASASQLPTATELEQRESPFDMVLRMAHEDIEMLEDAHLYINRKNVESGGLESGSIGETAAGIGLWLLPFTFTAFAAEMGVEFKEETDGIQLLAGNVAQELRKHIKSLDRDRDAQEDFIKRLVEWMYDEPNLSMTDFARQAFLYNIVSEDLFLYGQTEVPVWDTFDNISSIIDSTWLVGLLAAKFGAFAGLLRANRFFRVINASNKRESQKLLAEAIADTTDTTAEGLNVTKTEVAQSQLPKPESARVPLKDIPDEVFPEADKIRIESLRDDIHQIAKDQRASIYSPDDVLKARDRELTTIEQAMGPKIRTGMTRIRVTPELDEILFSVMLGKNATHGFGSSRTAIEEAQTYSDQGFRVRLYVSEAGTLKPWLTGDEAVELGKAITDGVTPSTRGSFYVQVDMPYIMRPVDKALFGTDGPLVTSPTWMGRASRYAQTPSAQFAREVYTPYLTNFLAEQAMVSKLERIVAPIFGLSRTARREVDSIFAYAEDFSLKQGRFPSHSELTTQFPEATNEVLRGVYLGKSFYDTVYELNNARLYRDWRGLGFKTLSSPNGNVQYHGEPLDLDALGKYTATDGQIHAYNPATARVDALSRKNAQTILENGGAILRMELPVTVGEGQWTRYVVRDPLMETGWQVGPLVNNPLKYIPGYYPRMYRDNYFITKTVDNAVVDGTPKPYSYVIRVASTQKEAERFVRRMEEEDPTNSYSVEADARLSQKDRTAMDRERMRTEGRLFFDDRQTRLYNTEGNPADIVSPTNMLMRTSRMVSRQVAVEDLIKGYKQSWENTYGYLVGDLDRTRASAVAAELTQIMKSGPKEQRAVASEAYALWDYIRVMDGNVDEGSKWFRSRSIQAAEWFYDMARGTPLEDAGRFSSREAHRLAPIETLKHITFIDFIVTRPIRQIVLQASQHIMLAPLDPTYWGKWQRDTFNLLGGTKTRAAYEMGVPHKDIEMKHNANAVAMGLSRAEYDLLIKKFDASGVVQTVNIHSFAGDRPKLLETPAGVAGDVTQTVGRTATLAPVRETLQQYGFDLGEQLNITASYLMALRLYRKEGGRDIKSLLDMTDEDWRNVAAKGSDFGLAMNRANAAGFQYGLISLPAQFLSFIHKTFLTGLRGLAGTTKFANKGFTQTEARKMLVGQLIFFGGAGYGLSDLVQKLLSDAGLQDVSPDIVEVLSDGTLDYIINKSLQLAVDDPELNLAVGEFLAPGANLLNTVKSFVDVGMEVPLYEGLMGASGATTSRMYQGFNLARTVISLDESVPTVTRYVTALEYILAGGFSGYSDYTKAKHGLQGGRWLSQGGQWSAAEVSYTEAIAKGMFGMNTKDLLLSYTLSQSVRDKEKALTQDAREYHSRIKRITQSLASGDLTVDQYVILAEAQKDLLAGLDPEEKRFVYTQFMEAVRASKTQRDSIAYLIAEHLTEGVVEDKDWIMSVIDKQRIPDSEKEALRKLFDLHIQDIEVNKDTLDDMAQRELDTVKNRPRRN